MDVTRENLESMAAKLEPAAASLSSAERDLLNHVFNAALEADGPEVEGFGLNVGGSSTGGTSPPKPVVETTTGTSGGTTGTGTKDTTTVTGVKSSSLNPVSIKFF